MSGASINSARLKKCDDTHVISFELLLDHGKQNGEQIWVVPVGLRFSRIPPEPARAQGEVMELAVSAADLLKEHIDGFLATGKLIDSETYTDAVLEMMDHLKLTMAQAGPDWQFTWMDLAVTPP